MPDDLRAIHADDQRRQRAIALAGDVAAYHAALTGAGVPDDLACAMTDDFNRMWLSDHLDLSGQMVFSFMGEDE
jgi:hypothetical protein